MRKLVLILVVLSSLYGCDRIAPVRSINQHNEFIREASFELGYPKDWKISNEEDHTNPDHDIIRYRFRHPKNRECYVLIEILNLAKQSTQTNPQLSKIVPSQIRLFKDIFERSGYKDFSFKTSQMSMAGRMATRLTLTAYKSRTTRTIIAKILLYKNNVYTISYQWFDPWTEEIRQRLEEITQSFRLF